MRIEIGLMADFKTRGEMPSMPTAAADDSCLINLSTPLSVTCEKLNLGWCLIGSVLTGSHHGKSDANLSAIVARKVLSSSAMRAGSV